MSAFAAAPQLFLSVSEYANWKRVSDDTVRRMIHRGELDAERVGPKLWRIPVDIPKEDD